MGKNRGEETGLVEEEVLAVERIGKVESFEDEINP